MSGARPVSVAFLWHMHQPWYGDPRTGRMLLPWVRLHALKDYLDMIMIMDEHPGVHVTFNLVPSLLKQVQQYADGETTDEAVECSARPAADLAEAERRWWLLHGFKAHWPRMIEPYPRYRELLDLRGRGTHQGNVADALRRFRTNDYRDLQVWFNLAWCGHWLRTNEPLVGELMAKERGYDEDEKTALLEALQGHLKKVIPAYVAAAQRGQIELTTTPFYHPILPLLCHYEDVHAGLPETRLPTGWEQVPEDAAEQLRRGCDLFEDLIGLPPVGLWPSEGSVSQPALAAAREVGFEWAATDEEILRNSLLGYGPGGQARSRPPRKADFVQPHHCEGLDLFFRDRQASDRIGFKYTEWDEPAAAANDLLRYLESAAYGVDGVKRPVISVILDGENCWEFYRNNGHDFLTAMYRGLAEHPWLEPVTFSEHRRRAPEPPRLEYLFPGSWIHANFYIWAGHRDDQRAWELLFMTRRALVAGERQLSETTRQQAWEHLYIAEGSDWFWWYGDDHSSEDDAAFDALFRSHLSRVYELLGQTPPEALSEPIGTLDARPPLVGPVALFTPTVDGRDSSFFEWRAAGSIGGPGADGAMSRTGEVRLLRRVRYGFDEAHLYFAIDLSLPRERRTDNGQWALHLTWRAAEREVALVIPEPCQPGRRRLRLSGDLAEAETTAEVAYERLIELGVPLSALPAAAGEQLELILTVSYDGDEVDRWPSRGAFDLPLPEEADWMRQWLV